MEQLKLTTCELLEIGFKKKITNEVNPYDSGIIKKRIIYEIPCINGCFYYNEMNTEYKWYHKTVIGSNANYISLNIEKKEELFLLLLCFKIKFNIPKPPKGLKPAWTFQADRMVEIQRAMNRYMAEKLPVPLEWIREYNVYANY